MAVVTVAHHPELTRERAFAVFSRHFPRYEVYRTKAPLVRLLFRDFVVEESGWTGVWVKLKQGKSDTTFVFTALMPSMTLQFLLAFAGLIPYLVVTRVFLRARWKAMEEEIRSFIENAEEFR